MGFWWMLGVLEIVAEAGHELEGRVLICVFVDGADDLFGVPHCLDLAAWITRREQPKELGAAFNVEAFIGTHQQATGPIQRVVFAAAMPKRFVLDSAPAFIEAGVGQLVNVERIGDLAGVGQHGVEHFAVRAR